MEVNYALPDRTLTITRPPRNRLPLVDFSYRPLFASLSVENILCAFGLLLTEAKARDNMYIVCRERGGRGGERQ